MKVPKRLTCTLSVVTGDLEEINPAFQLLTMESCGWKMTATSVLPTPSSPGNFEMTQKSGATVGLGHDYGDSKGDPRGDPLSLFNDLLWCVVIQLILGSPIYLIFDYNN